MDELEKRKIKTKNHEMGTIKNLKELLNRAAEKYADKVAFIYKKDYTQKEPEYITHTFKEFKEDAKALGTALIENGYETKKIAVIGPNSYEWCTTYIATVAGNMTIVPLDKALPDNEIKSLMQRSKADLVVFDSKYEQVFKELKEENKSLELVCMQKIDGAKYYQDLLEQGKKLLEKGDTRFENVKIRDEEMTILLFTSGTTSQAKGVMLSQKNIASNINAMPFFVLMYTTDTLLSFLPMHHTFECTITFLYGCLYCGARVAFCDGLKHVATNLKEYGVTVLVTVPLMLETMYKKIVNGIEKQGKTGLIKKMTKLCNGLKKLKIDIRRTVFKQVLEQLGGKIRLVLFGSAPMEKSTIVSLSNFGIEIVQGYGLTETSPVVSAETDYFKNPGSSGLIMCNEEAEIDNPNEEGIGEVKVKGPNVMLGYYENEEETNKVLKDGWFYTGDLGYFDEEGFLFLTGRKKDVIVLKNGKNVYPQEIEFLISKLPYVQENMVYGAESNKKELIVAAKIVYNPEAIPENAGDVEKFIWNEIKEKVNTQIPQFKHIKSIQITTEPMIKTTTQKVKRAEELKKITGNK